MLDDRQERELKVLLVRLAIAIRRYYEQATPARRITLDNILEAIMEIVRL